VADCDEKERLWIAYKKAFDVYEAEESRLLDAVGMMAHAEFEFLDSKVRDLRQLVMEARARFRERGEARLQRLSR